MFIGVSTLVATAACKKDDGNKAASAGKPASAAKAAAAVLPEVDGLKVTVPVGAKVKEGLVGTGNRVDGPGIGVDIQSASDLFPKTLEDAKKEATEMNSGTNFHEETLPDGYLLTFESKGAAGTNYWVKSLRTIDGKAYSCSVLSPQVELQTSGVPICKSLSK
jgi:hypothetical protein